MNNKYTQESFFSLIYKYLHVTEYMFTDIWAKFNKVIKNKLASFKKQILEAGLSDITEYIIYHYWRNAPRGGIIDAHFASTQFSFFF